MVGALAAVLTTGSVVQAQQYVIDDQHFGIVFRIQHIGISWTYGRFNELSGDFILDKANPANSSFQLTIKTDSLDTANKKRDDHLRSPDFFNVKQFPTTNFKSTAVKAIDGGYEVTGDLTLHGVTKPITFKLLGGKEAELPPGTHRVGFTADIILKRSDFGMGNFQNAIGDEVQIAVSFEGVRK
jgi:polyisoprenoid-binding protein YceI